MKKLDQYLFCFLLCCVFSVPMPAQNSELEPDELIINSASPAFINAHYGLDGIRLHDFFRAARLGPDTLRLGDDLRWSLLDGERLSINTALMIPGKFTFLDLDQLSFETKGSGTSFDEWNIGRAIVNGDPPSSEFFITRVNTLGPIGLVETVLTIQPNLNMALGDITPSQKLDVDGNARFRSVGSGSFNSVLNITSDGTLTTSSSDFRLKENITAIVNPLGRTLALRGVIFNWRNDENKEERIGLIAQEVEKVMPELVFTNEVDGYKGVRYQELSALLVEAIKEQQQIILAQQIKIVELEKIKSRMADIEKILGLSNEDN